jgi:hypothetical protein
MKSVERFESAVRSTQQKLQEFVQALTLDEQAVVVSLLGGTSEDEVEAFSVHSHELTGEPVPSSIVSIQVNTTFGQAGARVDASSFYSRVTGPIDLRFQETSGLDEPRHPDDVITLP